MGCGNVTISNKGINNNEQSLLNGKKDEINLSKLNSKKKKKMNDIIMKEMEKYQNIIKKQRIFLNNNIETRDIIESQDFRLKNMMGKKFEVKRKHLSESEIEEGIKQDEKEEAKRKGRKAYFSPMQKEVPFRHRQPEGPYEESESKPYSIGYENEIFEDINYGKPIKLYDQTWLTFDVSVEPNFYGPRVKVPPGWRIPTLEDYKKLFEWVGDNEKIKILLTHERLLNMKTNYQYITSDKVFNNNDDKRNNSNPWAYFCIGFNFFDEIDYPGIERLKQPNIRKKDNYIENNYNIINTKKSGNKEKEDEIISVDEDEDDIIKKINKKLKKEKGGYNSININNVYDSKKRLFNADENKINEGEFSKEKLRIKLDYIMDNDIQEKSDLLNVDKEEENNQDDIPQKFIFSVNIHKYSKTLRCKLISSQTLDITFKCPLVIEAGYRSFFELPKLYNITTFKWYFNDDNSKEASKTSNKFIASHIFTEKGEYKVDLEIELFSNRIFILSRYVWVIDEIEYGDEIILNGKNYGQPIKIGNQIWLDRDILSNDNNNGEIISLERGKGPGIYGENSYIESVSGCPNGWRLPLKEEVEELFEYAGKNDEQKLYFFTGLEGGFVAKLDEGGFYDMVCLGFRNLSKFEDYINYKKKDVYGKYLSEEEEIKELRQILMRKDKKNNIDEKSLQKIKNFYNIILNNYNYSDIFNKEVISLQIKDSKVRINFRETSMNSTYSIFNTRCILDQNLYLDLGLKGNNFPTNTKIDFSLDYPNITFCAWDFGDCSKIVKNEFKLTHSYKKPKKYKIVVNIVLFSKFNYQIKKEINIYEEPEETKLENENKIIFIYLGEFSHVEKSNEIHFRYASAPISPLIKENGFYISYNEKETNILKLCKVVFNKKEFIHKYFKTPLYEEESGIPLDITCTEIGCCLLVKDSNEENTLFIEMVSHNGKLLWRNIIMENGQNPRKAKINQLKFYNNLSGKLEFGTEMMFHPYSGRLVYGEGKISCIFSYKNIFSGSGNKRDKKDNSGDIILIYNEEGTEVNLVCPWSTSHSLTQRALFDGKYFFTASLGDSEPQNIKILRFGVDFSAHLGKYNLVKNISEEIDNNINKDDIKLQKVDKEVNCNKEGEDSNKTRNEKDYSNKNITEKDEAFFNEEKNKKINENKDDIEKDNKKIKTEKTNYELNESKKESELNKYIMNEEDEIHNDNLDSLLLDNDNQKENSSIKNSQDMFKYKDINLHFPLQNKFLNIEKVVGLKTDKELQDSFNAKNFEYYRQMEHIKMAIRYPFTSKNIVEGYIPGNCSGQSSGRIGGMHLMLNNKISLIYSRIKCDNDFGTKNDVSELAFLSFNNNLKIEKHISFLPGNYINCIKNARYGKNIFVMISETTKLTEDKRYIYDKYSFFHEEIEKDHLPCNCFLMNEEGELISDFISFNFNFFSPNDDLETLKDGSVVWTFIDDDNNLYLCFLPCKETRDYLNIFKNELIKAGIHNDFLIKKKKEEEQEKKKKEKDLSESIGIENKKGKLENEIKEKGSITKQKENTGLEKGYKKLINENKKIDE